MLFLTKLRRQAVTLVLLKTVTSVQGSSRYLEAAQSIDQVAYMARRANASSPDRARAASRSWPGAGAILGVAPGGSGGFCCIANTALAAAYKAEASRPFIHSLLVHLLVET